MPKGDAERGLRLQAFRERAGLSQEAVARELGVSTKTIWNWERGSGIHGDNLRALAEFYDRSIEELQGLAESPEPFALARFIDERLEEFREFIAAQNSERGQLLVAIHELGEAVRWQGELLEALSARLEVLGELQGLGEEDEGQEPSQGGSDAGQGPASTGHSGGGAGWHDLDALGRPGQTQPPSAAAGAPMRRRAGERAGDPPAS